MIYKRAEDLVVSVDDAAEQSTLFPDRRAATARAARARALPRLPGRPFGLP